MTRVHDANKALLAPLRRAFHACDRGAAKQALFDLFHPQAAIRLGEPFGTLAGPAALWDQVYAPLFDAAPNLERREFIVMAGPRWGHDGEPGNWVGLGGNFIGQFSAPWLDIPAPPTPAHFRYHEYLRIQDAQVVEMQGLWDLPQLMHQAGVWPMPQQAGVEWLCPGPVNGQGVIDTAYDPEQSNAAAQVVWDMLHEVQKGTETEPGRGLGGYWHDGAHWFGPTGLGTARGHFGISQLIFHQFRAGLSQNTRHLDEGVFFADRNLVAFTGWPSGTARHTGDAFLGIAATGNTITRASLDFWHVENGQIRDCWVMVDMIDIYRQLGVDIMADMRRNKRGAHAA